MLYLLPRGSFTGTKMLHSQMKTAEMIINPSVPCYPVPNAHRATQWWLHTLFFLNSSKYIISRFAWGPLYSSLCSNMTFSQRLSLQNHHLFSLFFFTAFPLSDISWYNFGGWCLFPPLEIKLHEGRGFVAFSLPKTVSDKEETLRKYLLNKQS